MRHPDSSRFSELLNGELSREERRRLESHLETCEACASLVRDLEGVRSRARSLREEEPPRDLWPGIASAIEGGLGDASRGIPMRPRVPGENTRAFYEEPEASNEEPEASFPDRKALTAQRSGASEGRWMGKGIHLTLPQALAASLILALMSGFMGAGMGGVLTRGSHEGHGGEEGDPYLAWVSLVSKAEPSLATMAREVALLERTLAEHREELGENTAAALQRNLAVIDGAIRESVAALEADPGNGFLRKNLEQAVLARGDFLRDAVSLTVPRA